MLKRLGPYRKTAAAVVVSVLGWATAVVESPSAAITSTEWLMLGTGVAVSAGVYAIANKPAPQ